MFVEAVVVLARGEPHIRVTRAIRPLFLVDTILLQDVRRYIFCICIYICTYVAMYCKYTDVKGVMHCICFCYEAILSL